MDAHPVSCGQVGMGLEFTERKSRAQCFNFGSWQGRRFAPGTDQRQHSRNLEHPNVLAPPKKNENVVWKQRLIDMYAATVLPPVHGPVEGQKRFDLPNLELPGHRFLVPGSGINSEPTRRLPWGSSRLLCPNTRVRRRHQHWPTDC